MKSLIIVFLTLTSLRIAAAETSGFDAATLQGGHYMAQVASRSAAAATLLRSNGTSLTFRATSKTNIERGKALQIARSRAAAGDTIVVGPGAYTVKSSLAKDGVNWHFGIGASVTCAVESEEAIWDDGNTRMNFSVTGDGDFNRITTRNLVRSLVVRVSHRDSVISIHGRDFTATGPVNGKADASVLRLEDGSVVLEGRYLRATGNRNGYVLWWFNGSGVVRAVRITGDYVSVGASVADTPTGDFHVTAEEIETAIFSGMTHPKAAMWIRCNILRDVLPDGGAISVSGSGRIYVETLKTFGFIHTVEYQGLLYFRARKHSATIAGGGGFFSFLDLAGGEVFYDADHIDPNDFGGDSFSIAGGTLHWGAGTMTGSAATNGVSISGGMVRLGGVLLDTSANSATSPIVKSGGRLVLSSGTALVAHGSAASISAPSPQTVSIVGTAVANRPQSNNVTLQIGTLTVDPNVP